MSPHLDYLPYQVPYRKINVVAEKDAIGEQNCQTLSDIKMKVETVLEGYPLRFALVGVVIAHQDDCHDDYYADSGQRFVRFGYLCSLFELDEGVLRNAFSI